MANAEYLQGPHQEKAAPTAQVEDPNSSVRAMTWKKDAQFMPTSYQEIVAFLAESNIPPALWEDYLTNPKTFAKLWNQGPN